MAMRLSWGPAMSFLLAVGGFHPRFAAPPGFPALERVALALASGDNPKLRLVRAQAWIWNNRKDADIAAVNRDELARALAEERPNHALWGDFT